MMHLAAGFREVLPETLACLLEGHGRYQGLLPAQGSHDSLHEELCMHVDTLLTVAATVPLLQDQAPEESSPSAAGSSQIQVQRFLKSLMKSV